MVQLAKLGPSVCLKKKEKIDKEKREGKYVVGNIKENIYRAFRHIKYNEGYLLIFLIRFFQ